MIKCKINHNFFARLLGVVSTHKTDSNFEYHFDEYGNDKILLRELYEYKILYIYICIVYVPSTIFVEIFVKMIINAYNHRH